MRLKGEDLVAGVDEIDEARPELSFSPTSIKSEGEIRREVAKEIAESIKEQAEASRYPDGYYSALGQLYRKIASDIRQQYGVE